MQGLKWWMRVVGVFYVLLFVAAALLKVPIEAFGFADVLARAADGDMPARFLVDTWVMFGLELGVIGVALLYYSRTPNGARALVWTVLGLELVRGIIDDIYMIVRGYELTPLVVWIVLHSIIIAAGLWALRASRDGGTQPTETGEVA